MKNLSYRLLYGLAYCLSLLPFCILYAFSDVCYLLVYHVIGYRRKVVRGNLTSSFPEKNLEEIKKIEKQFYRWLCDYAVETLKLLTISHEKILRHIEFRGVEQLEDCFDQGQNCATILGHYCNWEWISSLKLAFKRYPEAVLGGIYHPLYNEAFDRLFIDIRSAHGATCIPKKDILRHLLTIRQQQKHYLFAYISDQAPKWENMHLWLDFLNHDTPVFTGGERIMRKMHDAVFYVDTERPKRGYYTCTFKLITREPEKLEENEVTRQFFCMLEASIQRQPAFYLWTHNRWKRGREEFNRKYDIINGKIIRKEEYK